jgi:hypothetical protein
MGTVNLVVRNRDNPVTFWSTEAEARRWLEERRRTIAARQAAG